MPNSIPNSPALTEASPESLQELFSRDPETYQQQDRQRVIQEMRLLRDRLVAASADGTKPRVTKVQQPAQPINPSDLGL